MLVHFEKYLGKEDENFVLTENIRLKINIPFKALGLIQSKLSGEILRDKHTRISGAYGNKKAEVKITRIEGNRIFVEEVREE